MKIKDLSSNERPQERLLANGPEALSNGELLAVLLRSGTPAESAVELAQRVLCNCEGSLLHLSRLRAHELMSFPGIKDVKAAVILAAFELGRRFFEEKSSDGKVVITGARKVYEIMAPHLRALDHEECWVMYLDKGNKPKSRVRISSGTADSVSFEPKEIVREALGRGASSLILVHNHPGGNPEPSQFDIQQTEQLFTAANACSIAVLDHVIISDNRFYSFADEKVYHEDWKFEIN